MPMCKPPQEVQECLIARWFALPKSLCRFAASLPFHACLPVGFDRRETRKGKHFQMIQLIEELKNECSVMIRTFTGDKDRLKHAIINAEEQVRKPLLSYIKLGPS